ncbi:hypothetical protein [Flavobacterium sp.]|uniref:hypothetical protein n=1 Tax=Flavobacterium sp. TaxID=239 RepID=UPI00375026C9
MQKKISLLLLFFSLSFYGQNDTISVVRHSDNDLVIPKNTKVVFRGIKNEIVIDVPNCKSFNATGIGLSLISKNLYNLNPGAGSELIITIDIVLKNNKKKTEKHVFEIRGIKRPITCFNYIRGDSIIRAQKSQFKNAKIRVISADKNFNLIFNITQFVLKIPGRNSIVINGDKIDDETFEKINKYASKYDEIVISDIKIKTSFVGCILINPMVIKLY